MTRTVREPDAATTYTETDDAHGPPLVFAVSADEERLHEVRPWAMRDGQVLGASVFFSPVELAALVEDGEVTVSVEQIPSTFEMMDLPD